MDPVSLLLGLAAIVGTGAVNKVGENITDVVSPKVRELFDLLRRKLPRSQTLQALAAGTDVDYDQAVIEIEPMLADPEVSKLLAEVRSLVAQNQELQAKLDLAMAKIGSKKTSQVNRDRSQANQFTGNIQTLTINQNQTTDPD